MSAIRGILGSVHYMCHTCGEMKDIKVASLPMYLIESNEKFHLAMDVKCDCGNLYTMIFYTFDKNSTEPIRELSMAEVKEFGKNKYPAYTPLELI